MMPGDAAPSRMAGPGRAQWDGFVSLIPTPRTPIALNSLVDLLGLQGWKPYANALLLPPLPLLLLVLAGARLIMPRRGIGWLLVLLGVGGLWLSSCAGTARVLEQWVLGAPPALTSKRVAELKTEAAARKDMVIVVLGGGLIPHAPEYGAANLRATAVERLRYGLWLARETGIPVGFTGGAGWGSADGRVTEAQVAARIAKQEFGHPLAFVEDRSHDTRGNGALTIAKLRGSGWRHLILVTHAYHMPRAARAFRDAAGADYRFELAPIDVPSPADQRWQDWLPSAQGLFDVRNTLHEVVGLAAGA